MLLTQIFFPARSAQIEGEVATKALDALVSSSPWIRHCSAVGHNTTTTNAFLSTIWGRRCPGQIGQTDNVGLNHESAQSTISASAGWAGPTGAQ